MARAKVDLDFPKDAILWRLHKAVAELEDLTFTTRVLAKELNLPIRVVELCVEELDAMGLSNVRTEEEWGENPFTNDAYKEDVTHVGITNPGIQEIENWADDHYESIANRIIRQRGAGAEDLVDSEPTIPAADRIVSLDHNSPEHREAVEAIDKVVEELKKGQPLDNELGQEKHALIQAIEAGRRLLDDTRMNVEIGVKLLLEPLRLVAKKYTQIALGALASKAVDLVSKLLGLG